MSNIKIIKPLKGHNIFSDVFKVAYKKRSSKLLIAYTYYSKENSADNLFLGVSVPKKIVKKAVCRNRIKRLLRESIRQVKIDPEGRTPLINLGIAYSLNNQIDEAIKVYELLVDKDPNDPEGYYGLGQLVSHQDISKSLEYFCKAYNLYVEQKSIHRNEVGAIIYEIYIHMKEIDKLDEFNEILKKHKIDFEE